MISIKTHQVSADDGVRKSLDWDAYEIDWGISRGMQENTKVLIRKNDPPGLDTPRVRLEGVFRLQCKILIYLSSSTSLRNATI